MLEEANGAKEQLRYTAARFEVKSSGDAVELTRHQIRGFLGNVRALPTGAVGSDLERVFSDRADETRRLVEKHFGIEVSMDKGGVEKLDWLLNTMNEVMRPAQGSDGSTVQDSDLNMVCESLGVLFRRNRARVR